MSKKVRTLLSTLLLVALFATLVPSAFAANDILIGIPDDATNGGRAIKLLETVGLIEVDPAAGWTPELKDITKYLYNVEIMPTQANTLPGEKELLGRGVSYCATCDAPLYRGKAAAVIGYSPREEAEAAFLSEVCETVLYFPVYADETDLPEKVQVIREKVTGIAQENGRRIVRTDRGEYAADGVFVLREAVAPDQLVPGLPAEGAHVKVNRKMETEIPGIFACGDLTGTPYQYVKAAGEGNVAAVSAAMYVDMKKKQREKEKGGNEK